MKITCPACQKADQEAEHCARCGCELAVLRQVRTAAAGELAVAATRLKAGQGEKALEHAARAWALKNTPEAARMAFLAAIMAGQFGQASLWYGRIREQG